MKKIVYFLLFALCLPIGLMAQSVDDDLYFVPSKDKQEKKETPVQKEPKKQVTNIYTSPGTTVVVQDRKGRTRDVDEYNRRYDARENEFVMDNDTLYIKEKSNPDLDGEWVTGEFNGTQDDYEYAERIIRFRNPRFAISISSPLYWDVVYGPNSWDWNVYTDGMYAYAFPTFSNPMWWDWRYGSYGWGWNSGWGWNRPYYSWGYSPGYWGSGWYGGGYWGGWYGSGGYWGHHHHWHGGPSWGWGGGGRPYYAGRSVINGNNRSYYSGSRNSGSSYRRGTGTTTRPSNSSMGQSVRRSGTTGNSGRVVGTRDYTRSGGNNSSVRSGSSYSRRNTETYTRPSSTRNSGSTSTRSSNSGSYTRGSGSSSTRNSGVINSSSRSSGSSYSRGSSSGSTSRSSSTRSSSGSNYSRSSSGSSYSSGSSGSYSRSSGSSGSSSRSSGGGGSSRSSGGGGGHRR